MQKNNIPRKDFRGIEVENLKRWNSKPIAPQKLSNLLGLDDFSTQLLFNREIKTLKQLQSFLTPTSESLIDPYELPEMDSAVNRTNTAIDNKENIGIFGDFDVDGISATAILVTTMKDFGVSAFPYIPNRVDEGHGLNLKSLDYFK